MIQTKFEVELSFLTQWTLTDCLCVKISILSENQCKQLATGETFNEFETCGYISYHKCIFQQQENGFLRLSFEDLELDGVWSPDVSIFDTKYALVFKASFDSFGSQIAAISVSVPLVVVERDNQIPNSEALIFGIMYFEKNIVNLLIFDVRYQVDSESILQALSSL